MSILPTGWKDILRPIRDGLRDGFNPPNRGHSPTPEERTKQRHQDAMKGFAYFETFEQLQSWSADTVDPLHVSNTPFLDRPKPSSSVHEIPSARVLLCHDASGNYHEYESAQGAGLDTEQYNCERLQHVDTFVYFSHKLLCIPPASWTNTLHRHGVRSLGTFLVERDIAGYRDIVESWEAVVDGEGHSSYPLARQLAKIAQTFNFDGWLINLEKSFAKKDWDLNGLLGFLTQLREELGSHCEVVW